jgi:hypothetical protein
MKVWKMKKNLLSVVFILMLLSTPLPSESRYYGGSHRYRHHGWYHPRVFFGTSLMVPWYVPVAPPVYVYTTPVVNNIPAPNQAYAYPDPEFTAKYKKNENPPGEWVTVPGQWVNNTWVPEHRVQVPVSP